MTDFDDFSEKYGEILDESITISGEGSEYFAEYKALYLARNLAPGFSGKVLDFGCGVGLLSSFLMKHLPEARIHGYDISKESIRRIGKALSERGLFTSDMAGLHDDYDLIIVSNVMHHISKEQRQGTIIELFQRLAEGGRMTVFEHNPANPLTRRVVERCPFDRDAVLLPPKEVEAYLGSSGLRRLKKDYIVFFPRLFSRLRFLEPLLAWCPLGAQYVFTGEKNG